MAPAEAVDRLRQHWTHLDEGDWRAAAAEFAPDCLYLHPPERPGADAINGRDGLEEYLQATGEGGAIDRVVDHTVAQGDSAVVFGRATGPGVDGVRLLGVFVTVGEEGIEYYSEVTREEGPDYKLPRSETETGGPVDRNPVAILRQYWRHLEADEFEAAANQFTEGVKYLHPPVIEGVTDVVGRQTLYEYFSEVRGPRDITHTVEKQVVDGNAAGVLGVATGDDIDGIHVYVCYLEAENGEIGYYSTCNRDVVV